MRYLIKFSKESQIKFISHLDLLRTIQRIIRRTALPVEYSKGFNPHMSTAIAQPLSVGMYSEGEYMDVQFLEEIDEALTLKKLNDSSPEGIKFIEVVKVSETDKKVPQSMALIDAAEYRIVIGFENTDGLKEQIEKLKQLDTWEIMKKTKSGEKLVNIKPMVIKFEYTIGNESLVVETIVSCGSRENLSADLLSQFITNNTSGVRSYSFIDIKREEMYVEREKELIPLYKFVQ